MKKFKDNGQLLSHFYDYRIVSCPKCKKPVDFFELKVTCIHCGYHKEFKPLDCWYKLAPITVDIKDFLKIPCCGQTLWAMNLEHLYFLERYVESDLRERTPNINKSLASRLPQWIKSSKNRSEVLRCIKKLHKNLLDNNYKSRIVSDAT